MQAIIFNKDAYGYPADFKGWQKKTERDRTIAKNVLFQDSVSG